LPSEQELKLNVTLNPFTTIEVMVKESDTPLEIVDKLINKHFDAKKTPNIGGPKD